jgi:hypothetical protein
MDDGGDGDEPIDTEAGSGSCSTYPSDACPRAVVGTSDIELVPVLPLAAPLARVELVSTLPSMAPLAHGKLFPVPSPPASSIGSGLGSAPCSCPRTKAEVISKCQ